MQIEEIDLKKCATWVSKISLDELEGALMSGIERQKGLGKSESECAKYAFRNYRKELSEIIVFNKMMGVGFS